MPKSSRRIIVLDILRALAIVLVLGRHLPPLQNAFPLWIRPALHQWTDFGWIGVDLFFVLSGFLISGLLFGEYQRYGRIRVGRFLVRRGFKIYPPFYVMIATFICVQAMYKNYELIPLGGTLSEVFFVQNYHMGLLDLTWTLAVEEHFYLLLPLALVFLIWRDRGRGKPFRWLPLAWLLISVAVLGARIITASLFPYSNRRNLMPTHLRFDSLLFGVLISYYYHFFPEQTMGLARRFRWLLLVAGVAFVLPECLQNLWDFFVCTFGYSCLYIGFGLILLAGITFRLPTTGLRSIPLRVLAFVGAHSYSIYLWQMPVKWWLSGWLRQWFHLKPSPQLDAIVYLCGSIGVGIILSLAVEKPVLAIRDRLAPSRSKALQMTRDGQAALHPTLPPTPTAPANPETGTQLVIG
ncbi:MAG TPA: acyltransferase [Tepidisphaeraceae bacterium]|nr:acyltransferase [Tepidisphaeraceae bacterium]